MKTVKIMLPLLAALMFGNGVVRAQNEAKHDKPAVEVVVFHGVKQCQTCQAIKKNSQEVAEELAADGKNVSYRVVDFSKPEGKDEAKKYEIAWTSLLLIRHDAGDKETVREVFSESNPLLVEVGLAFDCNIKEIKSLEPK